MASAAKLTRGYRLFVGNLPWTIGHFELRSYFQQFGKLESARVVFDKNTGFSRGFGFVNFNSVSMLQKIENEQKHTLEGNILKIEKQHR